MPKLEKKLLLWVEKNMFLLMVLLAVVIGLYLRKLAVWWGSPDIGSYFDAHENNVQSSFYYLLVLLVQRLPLLPLHSIKWLAALADYAVAALCLLAAGWHGERLGVKGAFCLVVCILSPLVFLRGVCWAQIDSLAFAFVLGGYLLWEKGKNMAAAFCAAVGMALYPCFLLFVPGWLLCRGEEKKEEKDWIYLTVLALILCLLAGSSALILGYPWREGLWSCLRWMSYDPYQGMVYKEVFPWMRQMVSLLGYGAAMAGWVAACRRKISWIVVLSIHLAVLLVYGNLLFPVNV